MANVAKDLAQLISQSKSNKTGPYDTQATVKRVEGNTVWVSIPGGVDETPIDKTVNCSAGDKVQVRVSGGRAWITGNASAPPTDDTTAIKARTTANEAQVLAVDAKETADAVEGIATSASATAVSAKTIAEGVNEHFWHDSTGAHVTEVTQEEWNEPTDPNYHSGGNTLITTQGMAIRNGLTNLAEFGATGATIGVSGAQIAHLGYGPGTDSGGGTSNAPYYTLGVRGGTVGNYSVAEGYNTTASGYASHSEGTSTEATYGSAHAEGIQTHATSGAAHAEGDSTIASGNSSHAEGANTQATGEISHSEGLGTEASGFWTHAQNCWTVADQTAQTAIGAFNTKNNTNNLFVIGNGNDDNARSDAFEVDVYGNVEAAGSVSGGDDFILTANDNGLYGTKTDGTTQRILIGMSNANNIAVGYDSYSNADGNLNLYGNAVTLNSNTTITANQTITVGGNPMGLVAEEVVLNDNVSISGNTYGNNSHSVAKSGYTPIAIAGMHLTNASSSGVNNTQCALHSFYLSGSTAYWIVRNTASAAAKIKVTATVLYVKS